MIVNLTALGFTTFASPVVQAFAIAVIAGIDAIFYAAIKAITEEDVARLEHDAAVSGLRLKPNRRSSAAGH